MKKCLCDNVRAMVPHFDYRTGPTGRIYVACKLFTAAGLKRQLIIGATPPPKHTYTRTTPPHFNKITTFQAVFQLAWTRTWCSKYWARRRQRQAKSKTRRKRADSVACRAPPPPPPPSRPAQWPASISSSSRSSFSYWPADSNPNSWCNPPSCKC